MTTILNAPLAAVAATPHVAGTYVVGCYVLLLGSAAWTWFRLERGNWDELGASLKPGRARQAGVGLLVGLLSLAGLLGIELQAGLLSLTAPSQPLWPGVLPWVGLACLFAASEECLFRGFIYRMLRRGMGAWGSATVSAALYAVAHVLKADVLSAPPWLPLLGLALAGLFLARLTERLGHFWGAAGIHAGWLALFIPLDQLRCLVAPSEYVGLTGGGYPLGGALGMACVLALWWGSHHWWTPNAPGEKVG
ncbi:MAG: CPBP family intramembrane glutamic endopeptidase [Candidatus Sericytochromatia bacterium]|nr:CPBP family intramembrane glutamic endopeptidase [Candidatus Sericytochromatia bacterium]